MLISIAWHPDFLVLTPIYALISHLTWYSLETSHPHLQVCAFLIALILCHIYAYNTKEQCGKPSYIFDAPAWIQRTLDYVTTCIEIFYGLII